MTSFTRENPPAHLEGNPVALALHRAQQAPGSVPTESMVERAARAIFAAHNAGRVHAAGLTWEKDSVEWEREEYLTMARAAIAAMREPTAEMSVSGCPLPDDGGAPFCYNRSVTDGAWRAMIDAALEAQ